MQIVLPKHVPTPSKINQCDWLYSSRISNIEFIKFLPFYIDLI